MASNSRWCGSQRARRSGPRKPGSATTAGSAEKEEGSPETPQERPRVLGGALGNLAPLAKGLAPGPGGHGGRMAPKRLQDLLGQDFAAEKCRQTGSECGS